MKELTRDVQDFWFWFLTKETFLESFVVLVLWLSLGFAKIPSLSWILENFWFWTSLENNIGSVNSAHLWYWEVKIYFILPNPYLFFGATTFSLRWALFFWINQRLSNRNITCRSFNQQPHSYSIGPELLSKLIYIDFFSPSTPHNT